MQNKYIVSGRSKFRPHVFHYLRLALIMIIMPLSGCRQSQSVPPAPAHAAGNIASMTITDYPASIPNPTPALPEPDNDWPESSPEQQGMDSVKLSELFKAVQNQEINIHSILIARHGYLIFESYFHPFDRESLHEIYSCTKSVTSAAVGIAAQEGLVNDLDTPLYTYFPDLELDDADKKSINIRHLLTMTSGLEWMEPLRSGLNDEWAMTTSQQPAQYFLERPLADPPGSLFNYNTGGSHMLALLLQRVSGEDTAAYTSRWLFSPLNIQQFTWQQDEQGNSLGGRGLALRSRDLLKFGQLYLQQGVWSGKQILASEWVKESTRPWIDTRSGIFYGYQWWVRQNGVYQALGWGGQQVIVFPEQDMVVVVTAGLRNAAWNSYDMLLDQYILPAVQSDQPLPVNPNAEQTLKTQIESTAHPPTQTAAALPALAQQISGQTYLNLNGSQGWSTFTFHFEQPDEARLDLAYDNDDLSLRVGLDGLYRVNATPHNGPLALQAYWQDANTLVVIQQFLQEAERIKMQMTFNETGIEQTSTWTVEDYREESQSLLMR